MELFRKFERELTTSATEMASKDVDETSSSVCLDPLNGTDPRKEYNKNDLEYLLSVDPNDTNISMPVMKPVINYFRLNDGRNMREIKSIYPRFTPDKSMELLNRIDGKGLSIDYSFTRLDHINGLRFLSISLTFKNHLNEHIENIQMGKRYLVNRQELLEFTPIEKLAPNSTVSDIIGIDFNNSTQPVNFEIESSLGTFRVLLKPIITELIRPIAMVPEVFLEEQEGLRGLHELTAHCSQCITNVVERILKETNLGFCYNTEDTYRFAGVTCTKDLMILVTIEILNNGTKIIINSENTVFGEIFINHLINIFKS